MVNIESLWQEATALARKSRYVTTLKEKAVAEVLEVKSDSIFFKVKERKKYYS